MHQRWSSWILLAATLPGLAVLPQDRKRSDPAETHWDLERHLTPAQRAVNTEVRRVLPEDPMQIENEYDPIVRQLIAIGTEDAVEAIHAIARSKSKERKKLAASGRGLVFHAQECLLHGDLPAAARHSLDVYLSSAAAESRLEALRVYCQSADPDKAQPWLTLVAEETQDPWFRPAVAEFQAAVEARRRGD